MTLPAGSATDAAVAAGDVPALMQAIGLAARDAAGQLALAETEVKNRALLAAAAAVRAQSKLILAANGADMQQARAAKLSAALLDRLALDAARVEAMARSLEDIAALADPVGTVIAEWTRPNGLLIQRVRVPLGVIGII
jgi:glutamate-5-semialdehyde dehydrogenase